MDLNRLPRPLRVYLKNHDVFRSRKGKTGGRPILAAALIHWLSRLSNTGSDVRATLARDLWTTSSSDLTVRFSDGQWTSDDGRRLGLEDLLESIEESVLAGRAKRIDLYVDVSEAIEGQTFREIMEAIDELKADLQLRYDPTDDNASRYQTPYEDVHVSLGIVLSFHGGTTDYTEDFLYHVLPTSSG
jgi:hypothetical protein